MKKIGKKNVRKHSMAKTWNGITKKCSGRTGFHANHIRRVPLGKICVEYRRRIKHCRSQCHGGPNPKQGKKKNEEMRKGEKTEFEKEETRNGRTKK